MKEHASTRAGIAQRAWALLLAVALCLGLVPGAAWAAEGQTAAAGAENAQASAGTVTLTVTAGSKNDYGTGEVTYPTWVNKQYALGEVLKTAQAAGGTGHGKGDLTMEDLLDTAVAKGDLKAYDASESSYGKYLNSVTSKDGAKLAGLSSDDSSAGLYWSLFDNGGFANSSFDQVKLVGGNSYQFCWASYSSATAPSDWKAYYEKNPADQAKGDDGLPISEVATLTVTSGSKTDYDAGETTYPAWVNKQYALDEVLKAAQADGGTGHAKEDLTMEDLLNAAVAKGDLKGYDASSSSYGGKYLNSITSKDGAVLAGWNSDDYSLGQFWAVFAAGVSSSTPFDQVKLEEGASYQLCWDTFSSAVAPSDWTAYYAENPPAKADAGDGSTDPGDAIDPPTDNNIAHGIDLSAMASLMNGIAASYEGTTEAWKVMDMAAMGRLAAAQASAFIPVGLEGMKNPAPDSAATAFQRNIIALSAVGVDATSVPDGGGVYDALDAMAQKVTAASPVNVQAFTLLAYASNAYEVPVDAKLSEDALISVLCGSQLSDGGFSYSGSKADADMTAMVITALSPYASNDAAVRNVVNRALNALKGLQHDDGGFGATGIGVDSGTNTNSTAMAVVALCAAGIDPSTSWATESGATPLSALLSQAASDRSGFIYQGSVNDFATEQGFRALVAYQGLKNTGAAYNIYTQAKLGQAGLPAEKQEEESAPAPADKPVADKKALAKTGDGSAPFAAGTAVLALGALAAGIAATRRMRVSDELSLRR